MLTCYPVTTVILNVYLKKFYTATNMVYVVKNHVENVPKVQIHPHQHHQLKSLLIAVIVVFPQARDVPLQDMKDLIVKEKVYLSYICKFLFCSIVSVPLSALR